jgi:hypothetical protein
MATVAELVQDVADALKEPPETVNAYARALIDSGDLPKSRGRAIAQVGIPDIVKLMMAVAMQPKIKDTSETVNAYFNMMKPGVTDDHPAILKEQIAGKEICDLVEIIYRKGETDSEKDFRKNCFNATITIILNSPEIELCLSDGGLIRFKTGGMPSHWEGYLRRAVILSGRAFLLLGFGKGRDYALLSD